MRGLNNIFINGKSEWLKGGALDNFNEFLT